MCVPAEEGREGFHSLYSVFEAFTCKLRWQFRKGNLLWTNLMSSRYCQGLHPKTDDTFDSFQEAVVDMFYEEFDATDIILPFLVLDGPSLENILVVSTFGALLSINDLDTTSSIA